MIRKEKGGEVKNKCQINSNSTQPWRNVSLYLRLEKYY